MKVMYKLSCRSIHPLSQMDNTPSKAYLTHRHASATRISECLRSPANPISSLRPRQDAPIDGDFAGNVFLTPRLKALCPGCCTLDITEITESFTENNASIPCPAADIPLLSGYCTLDLFCQRTESKCEMC